MKSKIIAHRGAPFVAHENTMRSFFEAVRMGADIIEFDVRRTNDNFLIVHHDPYITSKGERIFISESTYENLQKSAESIGFTIPTVEEVLKEFNGKTGFDIELKVKNCEREIVEMISEMATSSDIVITSFDAEILSAIKTIAPQLKTGFLFEQIEALSEINRQTMDYLCPSKEIFSILEKNNSSLLSDYLFAVWTVDNEELIKHLFKHQAIYAVITNKANNAVAIRSQINTGTV